MKLYTLRLHGGDDLRGQLQQFAKDKGIRAGFIVTCVGALKVLNIRMAGATHDKQVTREFREDFEIVSLSGTIEEGDCHLHISAARRDAAVIGGHLRAGTIVDITAEIIIGEDETSIYSRVLDTSTKFNELEVTAR